MKSTFAQLGQIKLPCRPTCLKLLFYWVSKSKGPEQTELLRKLALSLLFVYGDKAHYPDIETV